ncbi:MAG: metallophosphoesterase [bacterium]
MLLGIITDIHEDAERLIIAIKELEKQNCDRIVCLGDISGFDDRFYSFKYSRNLRYCLDIIKMNCRDVIPGNHDFFQLGLLPKDKAVFDFPENWYELSFGKKKSLSKGQIWLYEKDYPVSDVKYFMEFFTQFTDSIIIEQDGIKTLLTHSTSPDVSGFLTKKPSKIKDFAKHFQLIKDKKCNIGISGHLHPNGLLVVDEKKIYFPKYSDIELPEAGIIHYVCPCIADGIQDNGFSILDTKNRTIKTIPLRTPKHKLGIL